MFFYHLLIVALLASAETVLGQTTSGIESVTVVTEQKTTERVTTAERTTEHISTAGPTTGLPSVVPEITVIREENHRWMFTELARFLNCGIGNGVEIAETSIAGSLANCGQKCLAIAGCLSFEFDTINKTCNLYNVSALENLEAKEGYTYADSVLPNVGPVHPCDDLDICVGDNGGNNCTEMCVPGGYKCHCPPGLMGDNCDVDKPVDGVWTSWLTWSNCSKICRKTSYRSCTDPPPGAGGKDCEGANTKTSSCSSSVCNAFPYIGCSYYGEKNTSLPSSTYNETIVDNCVTYCKNEYKHAKYAGYFPAVQDADDKTCSCYADSTNELFERATTESECSNTAERFVYFYAFDTDYIGCYSFTSIPSGVILVASGQAEVVTVVAEEAEVVTANGTEAPPAPSTPAAASQATPTAPYELTIDDCRQECAANGFSMALLQDGYLCYCANSLANLVYSNEDACDKPCGEEQICGGESAFSVYSSTYDKLNNMHEAYKTDWINQDDPVSDEKDAEDPLSSAQWSYCQSPSAIECFTTQGTEYSETDETEGFQAACTLSNGLVCDNVDLGFDVSVDVNVDTGESSFDVLNTDREIECLFNFENGNPGEFVISTLVCGDQTKDVPLEMTQNSTDSAPADQTANVNFIVTCSDYKVRYTCDQRETGAYIGCYSDPDSDSPFNREQTSLTASGSESFRELCVEHCSEKGYRMAGLKDEDCTCANSVIQEPLDYAACDLECSDTQKTPCGSNAQKRSVFMAECKKHFSATMEGTDLYKNDGTWLSDGWYDSLDSSTTVPLVNYTNTDLDLQLKMSLTGPKTISGVVTEGLNWPDKNVMTGVKTFYIGYRNSDQTNSIISLIVDGPEARAPPKVFTVSNVGNQQEHSLGRYVFADEIYIYVKTFEKFPGLKIDVIGCADD